jgi:protease-4
LRIDSPGGTVAASQEIAAMIEAFPMPVVVSMADTAASGGYYISAPADHVVAQPGTLTGSIGVIWASFDPDKLLDKLGIKIDAITAGKHKDMFLPGRLTPRRRQLVQEIVDTMHEQFVGEVARGRGLPESQVRKLATGEVFTGAQAVENGLVDELGGLETAVSAAESAAGVEDARVVEFSGSLFDQFLGPGLRSASSGTGPDAIDARLALLRELLGGLTVPRYEL